jgi:hypothetical protein
MGAGPACRSAKRRCSVMAAKGFYGGRRSPGGDDQMIDRAARESPSFQEVRLTKVKIHVFFKSNLDILRYDIKIINIVLSSISKIFSKSR